MLLELNGRSSRCAFGRSKRCEFDLHRAVGCSRARVVGSTERRADSILVGTDLGELAVDEGSSCGVDTGILAA
jgi:hypothetical protein